MIPCTIFASKREVHDRSNDGNYALIREAVRVVLSL